MRAADEAAKAADRDAVGLNAVHAVISAFDALTTFYLQERSRSVDHGDVLVLARRVQVDGIGERVNQGAKVLEFKNAIEYEARSLTAGEAETLRRQARRLVLGSRRSSARARRSAERTTGPRNVKPSGQPARHSSACCTVSATPE